MKHLPILNTPARAPALRTGAPHCPFAGMYTHQERHRQARPYACPSAERRSMLSSSLAGEKGRNTPPPEELLHMLGARFHRRQLQSCMPLFLSSPTTESSGQVIANAVPTHCTPFVWILALDSHWLSHNQPHHLHTFRVHVRMPPPTWHMAWASSTAPEPSQEVANRDTAPNCHWI